MASGPQQPPTQEALHVAATVCNQLHDDTPFLDSIDQPVRLEKDLSKPGDAKIGTPARMETAPREFCKAGQRVLDAVEDIGGSFLCIIHRDAQCVGERKGGAARVEIGGSPN